MLNNAHSEFHVLGRDGGSFLCGGKSTTDAYKFLRQCKRCGSANQWVMEYTVPADALKEVAPCTACDLLLLVEPKSVHCQQCEERGL
jgi:hypothetical protein